jgi:small subunit ribosomal protein S9
MSEKEVKKTEKKEEPAKPAPAKKDEAQQNAAESSPKVKQKAGPAPAKAEKARPKTAFSTGKRRTAVASASIKPGNGVVTLNSRNIDTIENRTVNLLLREPLMLVGDAYKRFNIKATSKGGGIIGQAQAARQAIAKALSEVLGADVREKFMNYDRNMLVYDPRRTETHKSPRSSQGPRRAKQKSKR